jgi:endonuclease YncB( thermonuclease family)
MRTLIFVTAMLLGAATATAQQGPGGYRVVDGDTIHAPFGVKYRLMGFDTPEIFHSQCDAELELGMAAKERLEELLASGEVRVIESGRTDKYRRTLAHVEVDGRDVGEILIGEGLARPYKGQKRKSWCE